MTYWDPLPSGEVVDSAALKSPLEFGGEAIEAGTKSDDFDIPWPSREAGRQVTLRGRLLANGWTSLTWDISERTPPADNKAMPKETEPEGLNKSRPPCNSEGRHSHEGIFPWQVLSASEYGHGPDIRHETATSPQQNHERVPARKLA